MKTLVLSFVSLISGLTLLATDLPPIWVSMNVFNGSSNATRYVGTYINGVFERKFEAPYTPSDGGESSFRAVRDLAQSPDGTLWVLNGTFTPTLWQIKPNGETTQTTFAGWSLVNQTVRGGLAVDSRYVFLTDNDTYGSSESRLNGLIRVNAQTLQWERFASGFDAFDVTLHDNKVYGIDQHGGIRVYSEDTLQLLSQFQLPHTTYYGMAVASDGNILVTNYDYANGQPQHQVSKFTPTGTFLDKIRLPEFVSDLDISSSGQIIVGGAHRGSVYLTDLDLDAYSAFKVNEVDGTTFVGFAPQAIPEPKTVSVIMGAASVGTVLLLRRRKK